MVKLLLSAILLVCSPASPVACAAGFVHYPTQNFGVAQVQGHTVYVSPVANPVLVKRALLKLDADLAKIHRILPPSAAAKLATIPFWIEENNPSVACMTYHASEGWLRQNGFNPDKARGIEIGSLRNFLDWQVDQPFMVLHEMSHAFHDIVLGFADVTVRWAYDLALAAKSYEAVAHVNGSRQRAYALTNPTEYFAEISEAYWGRNDFYPFNRTQLRTFDPAGFAMLEKMWQE